MQKWEYLEARAQRFDDGFLIYELNDIELDSSKRTSVISLLAELGKQGWELVTDETIEHTFVNKFWKLQIDNIGNSWRIKEDDKLSKLTDNQIIDYLNENYYNCTISGVFPTSKGTGYIGGWDILFNQSDRFFLRRLVFKRPIV
jgi:hypothetical protein